MSAKKQKAVDVTSTALELAQIMKEDPSIIEKDEVQRGNELIGVFSDSNFKDTFKDLKKLKVETIKMAIEDLAMGAMTLKTASVGLCFKQNRVQTFITPHGSPATGNVIFSINWKNIVAFKNYRAGEEEEIPQEDLNSAIYRLTLALSELL